MEKNIKLVELLNGEKLVGEVHIYNNDFEITNPVVIVPQKQDSETGNVTFAFLPWPVFKNATQKSFKITISLVVTTYLPNDEILGNYNRIMAQQSGIILPPSLKPVTSSLFTS